MEDINFLNGFVLELSPNARSIRNLDNIEYIIFRNIATKYLFVIREKLSTIQTWKLSITWKIL